jgi:hypothetical protein
VISVGTRSGEYGGLHFTFRSRTTKLLEIYECPLLFLVFFFNPSFETSFRYIDFEKKKRFIYMDYNRFIYLPYHFFEIGYFNISVRQLRKFYTKFMKSSFYATINNTYASQNNP